MAGYSGTPLVKKLGIKENFNIAFVNAPPRFVQELDLSPRIKVNSRSTKQFDFILFFVKRKGELENRLSFCAGKLTESGMLWIAWPKKASGVATDLTENVVRDIVLSKGLVDIKVCAIDDVWSGLKFVYRLKDRAKL